MAEDEAAAAAAAAAAGAAGPTELPVYTPADVARHCLPDDAWVSIRGRVLDVTRLLRPETGYGELVEPLAAAAGTDISFWFDAAGEEPRTHIDPATNLRVPYTPQGRFPHLPPLEPTSAWAPNFEVPWWRDPAFVVGRLSAAPRRVRIVNSLTAHEHTLEVGGEQTLAEIAAKYLEYNAHARGYEWKALGPDGAWRPLDMGATLAANGVVDEAAELDTLGLDPDAAEMLPTLMLYYRDDLTVA